MCTGLLHAHQQTGTRRGHAHYVGSGSLGSQGLNSEKNTGLNSGSDAQVLKMAIPPPHLWNGYNHAYHRLTEWIVDMLGNALGASYTTGMLVNTSCCHWNPAVPHSRQPWFDVSWDVSDSGENRAVPNNYFNNTTCHPQVSSTHSLPHTVLSHLILPTTHVVGALVPFYRWRMWGSAS